MSDCRYDRRTLLKNALVGLAALPASGLIREAAAQGALPHVDEKETLAVSLAYVQDVTKVDPSKTPQFKPGSHCANSCVINPNEALSLLEMVATGILISQPEVVVRLQSRQLMLRRAPSDVSGAA